jgi:hypothetical protein
METGARARGLAGCARGRALGDRIRGRWAAAAKVPDAYTQTTAHSVSVGAQCASARCAILIGSTAIKNPRIPLKPHAMFFSESRYSAIHPENRRRRFEGSDPQARFAHVSRTTNRQSHFTTRAFLIATRPELKIELTRSQQTRKLFLIATFSAISAPGPHYNIPLRVFLTATDPNSEIWQTNENKREAIF